MKILWNLLCQYASSYKYLKEKKKAQTEWMTKKKKKSTVVTVAIVPIEQTKVALFAPYDIFSIPLF